MSSLNHSNINKISCKYLLFRGYNSYIFIVVPLYAGIISFFLGSVINSVSTHLLNITLWQVAYQSNEKLVNNYLTFSLIGIVVITGIFITYRWSQIVNDGSYAYWLSQGAERKLFFRYSLLIYMRDFLIGAIIGVVLLIYPGGIILSVLRYVGLVLLLFTSLLLNIGLALFISEILKNPEFSAIAYIVIMWLNIAFNTNSNSILNKMFLPAFHYLDKNILLPLILSLVLGSIFVFAALLIHINRDINF